MNPVANTAVFIGLTSEFSRTLQRRVAFKSLFIAFFIILVFSLLGKAIFEIFGISLPALRITGGILVFLVGFHMLTGHKSKVTHPHAMTKSETGSDLNSDLNTTMDSRPDAEVYSDTAESAEDIIFSPLAIPILAGPGTIATAMNYAAAGTLLESFITVAAFFVICLITYICFINGNRLVHFVGDNGIKVISRLMGLILAVIGTQMLLQGVFDAINLFYQ